MSEPDPIRAENASLRAELESLRKEVGSVATANVRAALEMAAMSEQRQRELEQQSEALQAALDTARAAARMKDEFLAKVSHELRTPLNGIIGMSVLLADSISDADQRGYALTVLESANALLEIINDLLDLTRIEGAGLTLVDEPFDLVEVIDGVVSLLAPRADDARVSLEGSVSSDVPRWLRGDASRLRQILVNLVGNALKFTDDGSVTLQALRPEPAGPIELRVIDTGCGIPEGSAAVIFESFRQLDNSTTRRHGGTGLGLAISKSLVEMMGGTIEVESALGEGSTFRMRIPLGEVESGERPDDSVDEKQVSAFGGGDADTALAILVVEDNPVNQLVARRTLERLGHEVAVASSGEEALAVLSSSSFDLVLMDCQMPGMDGYETTRHVRDLEATGKLKRTPIVALTANAMNEDRGRCLAVGMDDYLSKPLDLTALKAALQRWGCAADGACSGAEGSSS